MKAGRFSGFVEWFIKTINEEKEEETTWQYYLHKVFEGTYSDFKAGIETNKKNRGMTQGTMETTVQHSMNILNNFNPEKGGDV